MKVVKRNKQIVDFDFEKIENAVSKAWIETEYNNIHLDTVVEALRLKFKYIYDEMERINVEKIQNMIEDTLAEYLCYKTLINFSRYRTKHEVNRNIVKTIQDVIGQNNTDIVHDNANIDGKTNIGVREAMSNEVIKSFNLSTLLPKHLAKAHKKDIYIHDLGYSFFSPFTNCALLNAEDMLKNGFKMGSAIIETPKSIRTASTVLTQCMANHSAGQYGGVSVHDVDLLLEPYVKLSYEKYLKQAEDFGIRDKTLYARKLTEKEVKDAVQTLEYQLNSLVNGHAQSIFCTLGFGYGTSYEARLIQKYLLETRLEGLGKNHETAIFPKLVFFCKKGINKDPTDPNYDIKQLAIKCSAHRLYPDWLMVDKLEEFTGGRVTPMGCRSFLAPYEENGKFKYNGRLNLGVCTVNLPRVALELKADNLDDRIAEYFEILDKKCELAHEVLKLRIKYLSKAKASCNPFLWVEGAFARLKPNDYIIDRCKNGYASISLGYIGIHETINGIYQENGQIFGNYQKIKLAKRILQFLSNKCKQWKSEEGFGYSLYGTPAESLCKTFLQQDLKDFGKIDGVTDKEYYTNSFHLDVRNKVSVFDKIDFESNFQSFSSGGFITFVELPSLTHNLEALENIIDYAYDKVAYFGINTPADVCNDCGFVGETEWNGKRYICPNCLSKNVATVRRVCGYLGNPTERGFNSGKQYEVNHRVKHSNSV
jgi:ribonucleoside-triphosphate reductase